MAREKIDLRDALRSYQYEFDLLQKIPCSKEENKAYEKLVKSGGKLPDGVYAYVYVNDEASTNEFYTIYEPDLTEEEIRQYLTFKKLSLLKSIKNCMVFFVVLTILSIVLAFIAAAI